MVVHKPYHSPKNLLRISGHPHEPGWHLCCSVARWRFPRSLPSSFSELLKMWILLWVGMSENEVYPQWNSHLVGIMISKTIGCRGTLFSDKPLCRWVSWREKLQDPHGLNSLLEKNSWVDCRFSRKRMELPPSSFVEFLHTKSSLGCLWHPTASSPSSVVQCHYP